VKRSFLETLLNRAPVAYAPTASNAPFLGLFTGGNSREQELAAMEGVSTLFSVVDLLAENVSQSEWKLWRKAPSGRKEDRTEVTRHAALDLWNKPNPFMTRQEFVEAFAQHLDLVGEAWWLTYKGPLSFPLELWPVRPDRMEPVPHPTKYLAGYVYCGPDGEKVPFDIDEVIFLRRPNPRDPYRGMGPVQSLLSDLDGVKYSAEWNRNFFLNSAEPGGIIEVPEQLSDTAFNELRTRWNEQHRGVANAHRVAILEHGKWVDRKFTQRDMQFAELRSISREIIREAYRVHGHMLGLSDDVNLANAKAADVTFARYLIKPRLERIKQALNNDLLPMFGVTAEGLEFDYENPVPEDEELAASVLTARADAAAKLVTAGWSARDVLEAVGLPEMEFGGVRREEVPVSPRAGQPEAGA